MEFNIFHVLCKCRDRFDKERKELELKLPKLKNNPPDLSKKPYISAAKDRARILLLKDYMTEINRILAEKDSNKATDFYYEHCVKYD